MPDYTEIYVNAIKMNVVYGFLAVDRSEPPAIIRRKSESKQRRIR